MTPLDWVAVAVIVGGVVFLRRCIVALGRRASAAARRRPVLWSVPLVLLGLLVAWKGPEWQLASRQALLTPKEYLELQNSYRATIVQALGGIALLFGLYMTWRRVEIAGEGQITERFTRAIEHLGSEKLEVRLGGIYALERIARDSERDHWPIMEVLTAYVRERSPAPKMAEDGTTPLSTPVTADIQAILTVIGRRRVEFDSPGQAVDLSRTNLSHSSFPKGGLAAIDLWGADLSKAFLSGRDLSGISLLGARLVGALLFATDLSGAELIEADLSRAHLERADLSGAYLAVADLSEADLTKANLCGVDLSETQGLTRDQIESAITDETTILPDYLIRDGKEESAEEAGGEGES